MANKIKLGARPKSFERPVRFPMLEGGEGEICCEFKYRTKTDFGKFVDGMIADAGESAPTDAKFSMADLMAKTRDQNATYLVGVLENWNLDQPLNRETAQQLCDELPGAAAEIMEVYRKAVTEGRLGN